MNESEIRITNIRDFTCLKKSVHHFSSFTAGSSTVEQSCDECEDNINL